VNGAGEGRAYFQGNGNEGLEAPLAEILGREGKPRQPWHVHGDDGREGALVGIRMPRISSLVASSLTLHPAFLLGRSGNQEGLVRIIQPLASRGKSGWMTPKGLRPGGDPMGSGPHVRQEGPAPFLAGEAADFH